MIVEQVHNGFLVAPDFKITEIDRKTSGLAGGYAGLVIAEQFFIGGGAYVLASNRHNRELAYGGLMMQWFGRDTGTVRLRRKNAARRRLCRNTERRPHPHLPAAR